LLDTTFLRMNRDIFLRTLCLLAVTSFFTFAGTRQGDLILAANALLMQFFLLFSYFMDGFAYAGEALCGKAWGGAKWDAFQRTTRYLFIWGGTLSVIVTLVYYLAGTQLLTALTDHPSVVECAQAYLPYVSLIPLISFPAFLYDGIFIGITFTSGMLRALAVATLIFFALHLLLFPSMGNTALWLAFLAYLGTRGIVQWWMLRGKVTQL
jgi:MATE family multidrug resistance protein